MSAVPETNFKEDEKSHSRGLKKHRWQDAIQHVKPSIIHTIVPVCTNIVLHAIANSAEGVSQNV